jgi:hypothetical protein
MVETANKDQAKAMDAWMAQAGFWLYQQIEQDHVYINKDDFIPSEASAFPNK